MTQDEILALADRLIDAYDTSQSLAPLSDALPQFDVAAAYDVLMEIHRRRRLQGWLPVGRKIGFTNNNLWRKYNVSGPLWAPVWHHTLAFAVGGQAHSIAGLVEPRIEPEIVVKLRGPVPTVFDAGAVLDSIEWIAPGFEFVQSHFPNWKFQAADCTAAFGLHGSLLVGPPIVISDLDHVSLGRALSTFSVRLQRGTELVDRGTGANVLGSPLHALVKLAQLLSTRSDFPSLQPGEIVTTGTLTDAWPIAAGETWTATFGNLPINPLTVAVA